MSGPNLAAYVHVPFCARVCPYCDFAVVAGRDELVGRYFQAVVAEIDMEEPAGALGALFIGGGTPSRVPAARVGAVVSRLRQRFGLNPGAEVSLEANPEDWDPDTAAALASAGVNRVSFGVQSFDDAVLAGLGRLHSSAEARAVVATARDAGIASVSLDLIFGSAGESVDSWRRSVVTAIELEPDHVSTYALTVERGTELSRRVSAGAPGPDPDDQADKYQLARRLLEGAGFHHYEVSNYARPGHQCAYNLNTWNQGDYLAFGLGAHGHRQGERRRNVRRLDAYLAMVEAGVRPEAGRETVDGWDSELERVFLGVRVRSGTPAGAVGPLLAADREGSALIAAGKLRVTGDRIVVLDPLFTDAVARVVLALEAPASSTRAV
jgi:oxygen-independent coproporphyrinogen-3 oxidase